jgi:hypothetical protein
MVDLCDDDHFSIVTWVQRGETGSIFAPFEDTRGRGPRGALRRRPEQGTRRGGTVRGCGWARAETGGIAAITEPAGRGPGPSESPDPHGLLWGGRPEARRGP